MNEADLIKRYPRLWHMAHKDAWPAIQQNGLMSAFALLDAYEVTGPRRYELGSCRRPQNVALSKPGLPGAVLRDQKPMQDHLLAGCLQDGLSPREWYERLNSKSFFWLSRERVWRLLKARAYRDVEQTVLTLDTAKLVAAYREKILLSPINSGSTLFNAQPRGNDTFKPIAQFPFDERAKTRHQSNNVVELLVDYSVPDVADYVLSVHEVKNDAVISEIWASPSATNEDSPALQT